MGRTGKVNTRISPGLHVRLDCNTRVHHLRRFRDVRLTRREDRHAILGLRWLDIGDLHLVTGHMERGYMPGQLPDDLLALLQVFLKIRGLSGEVCRLSSSASARSNDSCASRFRSACLSGECQRPQFSQESGSARIWPLEA